MELNASNERGIDTVRHRIKLFAQTQVSLEAGKHKIVILDEADSMTEAAQQALRRTMEIYSKTTRFALACNTSEKIIEPIQSRCAVVRFGKLTDAHVRKRITQICNLERVTYDHEGIDALIYIAQGDLRTAINNLQSTVDGFDTVTQDNVYKVCDEPHPKKVKRIIDATTTGDYETAFEELKHIWDQGYSAEDVIINIFRSVKGHETMTEVQKLNFMKEIGLTHLKINQGLQTLLQLDALLVRLCKVSKKK